MTDFDSLLDALDHFQRYDCADPKEIPYSAALNNPDNKVGACAVIADWILENWYGQKP